MFKKEYSLVLLSLLICILAISSVSAADDAMNEDLAVDEAPIDGVDMDASISDDVLKSENDEEIITDYEIEDNSEETLASVEEVVETPKDALASAENDEKISEVSDDEVLSSPSYDKYNLHVYDVYVKEGDDIEVPVYITPYTGDSYAYDFYLRIYDEYDSIGEYLYSKNEYSYEQSTYEVFNVDEELSAGNYIIKLINYADGSEMDSAYLYIIGEEGLEDSAIVNSPSYGTYEAYVDDISVKVGEEISIPIDIYPNASSYYAYDFYIRLYDSQGNEIEQKNLYNSTNRDDHTINYDVSNYLSTGTYTIKLINYVDSRLLDSAELEIYGGSSSTYGASVNDISRYVGEDIVVPISINPNPNTDYAYDFYLKIFDSYGDQVYSYNLYSRSLDTYLEHTIYNDFSIGTYTIKLINYTGGALLDTATLTIKDRPIQNATITISQSGTYYNQKYVTVKVIDRDTKAVIKNCNVALKFSNGKSVTVTTNSNGVASYKVPFDAGTYSVQAVSVNNYVKGQSPRISLSIRKHTSTITMKQVGKYYKDKKITVKLYDSTTKSVVKSQKVVLKFSNGKKLSATTNSKGIATFNVNFKPGKYTATASVSNKNIAFASKKLSKIKIVKVPIKIVVKKFKTSYDSGKYFKIKVINRVTKKAVKGVKLKIKIKGGKTLTRTTKAGGKISFDASKYKVGKHKVSIKVASKKYHTGKAKKTSILIKKGKASIYAPETINALKSNDNYTIWVYNNYSYRPVKGAKVTIKVYTGKKAKTYTRKTDADGVVRFNTKSLKKGKHKVVVSLKANKKYKKAKGKGLVEISKKIPTNIGYYYPLHYRAYSTTIYIGYYGYTTTHVYAVGVDVYLRDKQGNDLYGKTVKVTHSNGNSEIGNSGDRIYVSGSNSGSVTLSFAGDSKYLPSTYTFNLS